MLRLYLLGAALLLGLGPRTASACKIDPYLEWASVPSPALPSSKILGLVDTLGWFGPLDATAVHQPTGARTKLPLRLTPIAGRGFYAWLQIELLELTPGDYDLYVHAPGVPLDDPHWVYWRFPVQMTTGQEPAPPSAPQLDYALSPRDVQIESGYCHVCFRPRCMEGGFWLDGSAKPQGKLAWLLLYAKPDLLLDVRPVHTESSELVRFRAELSPEEAGGCLGLVAVDENGGQSPARWSCDIKEERTEDPTEEPKSAPQPGPARSGVLAIDQGGCQCTARGRGLWALLLLLPLWRRASSRST